MKIIRFALLAFAVLSTACQETSPAAPNSGPSPASPALASPPAPPSASVPVAAATTGPLVVSPGDPQTATGSQAITINALQGEPDSIDPTLGEFSAEAAIVRQVFEPLLRLDASLNPVPATASSFEVSPDGKTYTFHIRASASFSDGTPVTAQDFVYSFQRILDPATAAPYASYFIQAGIVGAKAFNSGAVTSPDSLGVKALDDHTLQVSLDAPAGYFPDLVALWVVPPLRPEIVQSDPNWTQSPSTYIGNGPFEMTEWVHQDHITLAPNPYYWGGPPPLQKVTFPMVTDAETDFAAYKNGEREWALVPPADVQAVQADSSLRQQIYQQTALTTFWILLNNARPPLNNALVRRALARSVDRTALVRDVAEGAGQPTTSVIPPGMPGFQPDAGSDLSFDPAAARALLAQAGFADPSTLPALTFSYASTSTNQARAEFIQAQLQENLGISVSLDPLDVKSFQAAYDSKQFDLAFGGANADYPDPQDLLSGLFTCSNAANVVNYCDPAFDAAVHQGDTDGDPGDRLAAYARAQTILLSDVPIVPLFNPANLVVVQPDVHNLTLTAADDYPGDFFLGQVFLTSH